MTNKSGKRRANLRDVAKTAGVSSATVSRVLNNPTLVSEETRKRVQNAMESLHFVPSAAARAINSGRSKVVGALVPTLDNAIFAKFLATLEYELGIFGLSLVVATTGGCPDVETEKARQFVDIGVEALIVSGITHSKDFNNIIARAQLPTIATSYFDDDYYLPTIGYDNASASRLALECLLSADHKTVAVIHGPVKNNDRTRARLSGLNVQAPEISIDKYETNISVEGGAATAKQILADVKKYSAILCTSDVLALGALFELQKQKIRLPEDMSLIGIDDLPVSSLTCPAITSVHLSVSKMGKLTADAVIQWIEKDIIPTSKKVDVYLIPRQSTSKTNKNSLN